MFGQVTVEDSTLNARNGIHLNPSSAVVIEGRTHLTAQEMAIEAYDRSRIEIYSGWIYGGQDAIHYLDSPLVYSSHNVRGGYFSHAVGDRSLSSTGSMEFNFVCTSIDDPVYPYAIARQYRGADGTYRRVYQVVSESINRNVVIDQGLLEDELDTLSGDNASVTMIVDYADEADRFPDDLVFKELYDIRVNIGNESGVQYVQNELDEYQLIKFSFNEIKPGDHPVFDDANSIVVYHQHGNEAARKLDYDGVHDGTLPDRECYFITQEPDGPYINIYTKKFSVFGFTDGTVSLGLSGIYSAVYETGKSPDIPSVYEIEGHSLLIGEDIEILYEGIDGTDYYSYYGFPYQAGTYQVTWTTTASAPIKAYGRTTFKVVDPPTVILRAASLYLEGAIGVNFKVNIPEELMNVGTIAQISHPERGNGTHVVSYPVESLYYDEGSGYYYVTDYVYSTEMKHQLVLSFVDAEGNAVRMTTGNGTDYSYGYHYSVQDYLDFQLSAHPADRIIPLIKSMDFYSKAALNYWKGGDHSLDAAGLDTINAETLSQYQSTFEGVQCEGISDEAVSLVLESTITIRYKFIVDEDHDIDSYVFRVNGSECIPEFSDTENKYILEIDNVYAYDFDKMFEIEIEKDGNIFKRKYSALSYAYGVLANDESDQKLADVVKTMYNYCKEAETYFKK